MNIQKYIPTSLIDYPGNIATVLFTAGCNWNCWYCQNRPLLNEQPPAVSTPEFLSFLHSRLQWIDAVVICGGEPTLQHDLPEFIAQIKSLGLKIKLDTNGSHPQVLSHLLQHNLLDYIAMDIKAPLDKYHLICGSSVKTEHVMQSIDLIVNSNIHYEFRTTVSPDLSMDDLLNIAQLIQNSKIYYLQQYVPPTPDSPPAHSLQFLKDATHACNQYVHTKLR